LLKVIESQQKQMQAQMQMLQTLVSAQTPKKSTLERSRDLLASMLSFNTENSDDVSRLAIEDWSASLRSVIDDIQK
jgi:hypothetical protein